MQIEIERKFRADDFVKIKAKLFELKAIFIKKENTKDIYFVIPQKTKNTKYLRIRIKNNSKNDVLAYHEVISNLETREWETEVNDAKKMQDIIQKLGFKVDVIVDKEREEYELDKLSILLDKVKNLGYFIEIEAKTKEEFDKIISKLELEDKNIISGAGYPDLLREKFNS